MGKTKIDWSDYVWNPILGCSRVSEGCRNCYAEAIAGRFRNSTAYDGLTQIVNGRPVWSGQIRETRTMLEPMKWKKPKRVFVNSMSDLFHENVSDELRDRIFAVMALCPQHTFQVLTKRPERMLAYCSNPGTRRRVGIAIVDLTQKMRIGPSGLILPLCHRPDSTDEEPRMWAEWPLPNVWLGVSVENQAAAHGRIPLLLRTPAAMRFISAEPLLGPIDFSELVMPDGDHFTSLYNDGEGGGVDWVIVGGESGHNARPMDPDWARSLRDQCAAAGVAFWMKQMGSVYGEHKGKELPDDLNIKQFPAQVNR
jgi:protein gp37